MHRKKVNEQFKSGAESLLGIEVVKNLTKEELKSNQWVLNQFQIDQFRRKLQMV